MKNPWLLFLPFLLLYVGIILYFRGNTPEGDEVRYLLFAKNLLNGFYSPPAPNINLWNGPGYPLLIAPFVALQLPLICIALLNAVFYYLSLVLLFKTIRGFASFKITLLVCLFWALYYNIYQNLPEIMTEVFAAFLIALFAFCLVRRYFIPAGVVLGYLVLTKIIFGYVLLILLVIALLYWIFKRKYQAVIVCGMALNVIMPYLIYTQYLTGRVFYLGNSGGLSLYWMADLSPNEYGDWKGDLRTEKVANGYIPGGLDSLTAHHAKDAEAVAGLQGVEKDDSLKAMAVRNIKADPLKYLKNCCYNVGRLLFNYPYSYQEQTPKTLLRIPMNFILVLACLISVTALFKRWNRVPGAIKFLTALVLIYLAGSVMVSAYTRMFTVIVPGILVILAYFIPKKA